MQQVLLEGLLRTAADPRLQQLVTDFHSARTTVSMTDSGAVKRSIHGLLNVVHALLNDLIAMAVVEDQDPAPMHNAQLCLTSLAGLLDGPFLDDVVVALQLFRKKLPPGGRTDTDVVLRELDEHLRRVSASATGRHPKAITGFRRHAESAATVERSHHGPDRRPRCGSDASGNVSEALRLQLVDAVWALVDAIDSHCVATEAAR